MPPSAPATTQLPANPSLALLGKLARQLRKAFRSRDPSALARVRRHHPARGSASPPETADLSLRNAQLVIARERGFDNWTELKRHVERSRTVAEPVAQTDIGAVRQIVPLLDVSDIRASLTHYVDRLGFAKKREWVDHGQLAWCWLEHGSVALMLQQPRGKNARAYEGPCGSGLRFACLTGGDDSSWPHHAHLTEVVDDDGYTLMAVDGYFSPGSPQFRSLSPVLDVVSVEESCRFYVDGLGFRERDRWTSGAQTSRCRLQLDEVHLVLDRRERVAAASEVGRGQGVQLCYMCDDALTVNRVVTSRGVSTREPFVGNGLWVVEVSDADGYRLAFESPADSPEDTTLSEINSGHEPVDRYGDQK